jgi:hypothetical protein
MAHKHFDLELDSDRPDEFKIIEKIYIYIMLMYELTISDQANKYLDLEPDSDRPDELND